MVSLALGHVDCFYFLQHWSVLDKSEGPWPVGRHRHAAVCLWNGGDHPQLLVTGGMDEKNKVLSDMWLLDLHAGRWREVRSV